MSLAPQHIPSDEFYAYDVRDCCERCLDFFRNSPTSYPEDVSCFDAFFRVLDDMENEKPFSFTVYESKRSFLPLTEDGKFKHRRPVWQVIAGASAEVFRITFQDQKECATSLKERITLCLKYLVIHAWLKRSKKEINIPGLSLLISDKNLVENEEVAITIICHPHLTGLVTMELMQLFFTNLASRLEELVKQNK